MEKDIKQHIRKGLPGGPNELNKFTEAFIMSSNGQYDYPGQNTLIPNADGRITMKDVDYPVYGIDDEGNSQMMYPEKEYQFPGNSVYEIPMKKGGLIKMPKVEFTKKGKRKNAKAFSRSLQATNRLFTENTLFKKPKSRKRKVFDPKADYQEGGSLIQAEYGMPMGTGMSQNYQGREKSFYAKGGALLTKEVTCKKCGWEWDAADGGDDITTCHKCGGQGLVHAQGGGDISIPTLNQYPDGGQPRPVQGMAKPLAPLAIRQEQVKPLKNSPKVSDQKKYKAVENEVKAKATIQKASKQLDELQKDALPQHEQPLTPQDWIWTLPLAGGSAMKSAGTAIADGVGAVGTKVMPYVTGALETSLPFMKAIPGATVGNALGAGFAVDAAVNRLPKVPGQIARGEYMDAAENVITGGLDVLGAGVVSPIYEGARGAMSGLKKFVGTEEGLLSNAYKVNPWAFKPNSENIYRGIGKGGMEDAFQSGVIRNNPNKFSTEGIRSGLENGSFRSPYFVEGKDFNIAEKYANGYIAETPLVRNIETGDLAAYPSGDNWGWTGAEKEMPLKDFNILKKDWLRGYKEVPFELPKSTIKSAERFPESSWQQLIQEDKAFNTPNWLKGFDEGGVIETELTEEEIEEYRRGGWIVENI